MSTTTAYDIIQKALQKIGVLAEGETATAAQMQDGLDALNMLLDSWSGRSLLTSARIRESFALTANQATYTIGVGAGFNTSKPFEIVDAFVRDGQNIDYPVGVVSRGVYDAYDDKALTTVTSRPESLFYDPGATQQANHAGTIYLYPTPDGNTTYTLFLESEKPFTTFSALTDTVTFLPAYKRALVYNLAIEMAADYGRAASAEVRAVAGQAMRIVENVNSRNKRMVAGFDFPGSQQRYNIYSDGYNR